jgi:cellulose synthase operon protein C
MLSRDVMLLAPPPQPVIPEPADLDQVRRLYGRGLCLEAYQLSQRIGPLQNWTGTAARLLAGRLAMNTGAARLGHWLHTRAYREAPQDPGARYYRARALLERRGPLAAWQFLKRIGPMPEAAAPVQSDWLALHACVLGCVRDFDAAEHWLDRAEHVCPDRPWTCIERGNLLEWEDRYDEALAASRRALDLVPWYRPAVQAVAHHLQLLGRERAALDLLVEADKQIENAPVAIQLALLQTELGRYAEARRSFARAFDLAPLIEKDLAKWLAARRADVAYYCGDYRAAAEFARRVEEPFYDQLADRLSQTPAAGRRVLLDVGFVRQHHQTCAPATLAALSRFWDMPADHLEVAEAICYDGTPDHRERHWAEQHGWHAREFTVTWDSAVALLDRGIPFTLTLTQPTNAHLQAVIGYDTLRKTLLVRDPYLPHFGEFLADEMVERYRSTGPRGMALVPLARTGLLDNLELPEAPLYDHLYRLQRALQEYDRATAADAYQRLRAEAPGQRLTLHARRILATYDADRTEQLACDEELLELFPNDGLLQLRRLTCLRDLARRDERLELLRSMCACKESDPVFWRLYAEELAVDAREHEPAARWLRRAVRFRPLDAGNFWALAGILWAQRRFAEALELYRFAACLNDKDEAMTRSYFIAARQCQRTDEALTFLHKRFQRFGRRSSQPARTLYDALDLCERKTEARSLLDEARRLHPEDGQLMLFTALAHARAGAFGQARALLAEALGRTPASAHLRTSAELAEMDGQRAAALDLWGKVLEAEPLALDANRAVALLRAQAEGRSAALAHLEQACNRFPHNYALHQLWIDWLRADGLAGEEPIVRRLIAIHPADAWARRELALVLSAQGRHEEASAELDIACGLEPASAAYHVVRGQVLTRAGRLPEAKEAYREALRLAVDNEFAMSRWLELCESPAERRQMLRFVKEELVRQTVFGDGLLAYQRCACDTLSPEELQALLREALAARPDLWHAWSALVLQLLNMRVLDEAFSLARQATQRFSLLPRVWLDLAAVCQARQDAAGEIEALDHALRISPGWSLTLRRLAEAHDRAGRLDQARAVLERAVARAPLDALNHGCLADVLWRSSDKEAALARVQQALLLDADYNWGWNALRAWSRELSRPEVAVKVARDLSVRRPGEARSWLILARTLPKPEDLEERLSALDTALALNPRCTEAADLKAELLASVERYDEALAACRTRAWAGPPPVFLRGRAAWIEAQRGQFQEAIQQMQALVAEDSDYGWGWYNLADWQRDHASVDAYLATAEQLVRVAPDRATSYGFRGEARARKGDRPGSKADFARALELNPRYSFGAMYLFDLQFKDDELEPARKTLDLLKEHPDDYFLAREVQWACRRGERHLAMDNLKRLSKSSTADTWPLNAAYDALARAHWLGDARHIFEELLGLPAPSANSQERFPVHPWVGALWIRACAARNDWSWGRRLDSLLARGDIGTQALGAYVREIGKARRGRLVRRCLKRYREALRADSLRWGISLYALVMIKDVRGAARWGSDWAERQDAQAWMLSNLVLALRALHRDAEANAVSRHALTLPADDRSKYHQLWLALDKALIGETGVAAGWLQGVAASTCDATHRLLHSWVQGLTELQQAPPAKRGAVFAAVRRQWHKAAAESASLAEDSPAALHAYRQCVLRLARDRGGFVAWLWSLCRRLAPTLQRQWGA